VFHLFHHYADCHVVHQHGTTRTPKIQPQAIDLGVVIDRRERGRWWENDDGDGRERNQNMIWTNLHVPVPLEIKDSKTTDVPQRVHVDGELPEEIYDRRCAIREREPQHERG